MNGVFDNTSNKQYNNAKPNYDVNDGIDNVKCDNEGCKYRDVELGRCLFETCIYNQFPLSIPYHESFKCKCKFCDSVIELHFDDIHHPFDSFSICDSCMNKLSNLIKG